MAERFELQHRVIHGHDIGFRSGGSGPVLLLVHGMAGSSATWLPVLDGLAEHFTVVAPDLLGHGASAKPRGDYSLGAFANALRDLLVTLGHERVTLVGQSLGGGVALQFAYQFPERCERLVLVSSGGLGAEVHPVLRALAVPGAEYVLPLVCTTWIHDTVASFVGGLRHVGLRPSPNVVEVWDSYGSLADGDTRTAFLHTLRSVVDPAGQRVSARDRLYLAAMLPTLIVWGDHDKIIPVAQAYATHDALPHSRLEIFPGAGHYPHAEAPQRFVEVLCDFMRSTAPADFGAQHWQQRLLEHAASEA
ncbi:MAG TPA: alpha/beta fold hydrolase [Acidimicrobiia bacterium]|jgi:pimeloyl-ACP methyl ester carboxylesterase